MMEQIITAMLVIVILGFVCFVLKDYLKKRSVNKPKEKKERERIVEMPDFKKILPKKPVLFNGPVIYVREEKGGSWKEYQMTQEVITIGRNGTICIDKDYFAEKQFELRRCMDGNEEYYLFTELAKVNRTRYFDKRKLEELKRKYKEDGKMLDIESEDLKDCLVAMHYKDELELEEGEREVFYVGNVKFVIDVPYTHQKVVASDFDPIVGDSGTRQRKRKTTRTDGEHKQQETLNKKGNEDKQNKKTSDWGGFDVNI